MTEILTDTPLTAFDAIAIILILVSGLMAFARGLIRELASLIAFVAGLSAAYASSLYLGDWAHSQLPPGWPTVIADAGLVIAAFIIVYTAAAWLGTRLSKVVHAATDIGLIDRVAGLAFGAFRGVVVIVVFVILLTMALPPESIPRWISEGRTYSFFEAGADYARALAPGITESAS